ncbi:hypothetical protein BDN72DRAFT_376550 [Pluteus cervinus]|uniref:Uncharacterized protein n=1 Tax=Pluteus cervinus TaxID=181527 RepID=A0ACD3AB30_9AGAR|nr:hypothetical protein BDN72DRAFT_376550 [Pluteus cervinus]
MQEVRLVCRCFHTLILSIVRRWITERAVKSASFNAAERGDPPKCHPDTRIAVQDSLKAWRTNRTAGPVRLISGWAGTGKTTIAQTMAEYWAREGQLAGSFFFSRSNEERSETLSVQETILHHFFQIFGADVDVGHLPFPIRWSDLIGILVSISSSLSQPLVVVIDGLDECTSILQQIHLLREILESLGEPGSSIKILISCRPERHVENLFKEFAHQLGPSYRIHLGQSAEDNNDIRMFFRVSFDRIYQDRCNDMAISITDGLWPSQEEVEGLVYRASGQFIFAATVVRFVDDETEDPVEMLNLVMEQRTSSFEAIDQLYVVILDRVEQKLNENKKPLELRQLMRNLILHVNYEPSSSLAIADFWFEKEVTINILVKHLQALLIRPTDPDSQNSQNAIQFRHKSFHDFFVRPSVSHDSHPFSLAKMNPVSKFFFSLRTHAREAAHRPRSDDRPPTVFPYEEEARRLHQAYIKDRPTFRGCMCLPQLESAISNADAFRAFKPCRRGDCVADSDLLTLCRMIAIPHSSQPKEQERLKATSSPILKFFLWLRAAFSLKRHRKDMQ